MIQNLLRSDPKERGLLTFSSINMAVAQKLTGRPSYCSHVQRFQSFRRLLTQSHIKVMKGHLLKLEVPKLAGSCLRRHAPLSKDHICPNAGMSKRNRPLQPVPSIQKCQVKKILLESLFLESKSQPYCFLVSKKC